jgi:hypothetical protein
MFIILSLMRVIMEAHEYYMAIHGKLHYKEAALEFELTEDYVNWLEKVAVEHFNGVLLNYVTNKIKSK